MAAELYSSRIQIRTDASEAGDQSSVKSISLSGADVNASASLIIGVKDAIADVIANDVINVRRVDTYTINED